MSRPSLPAATTTSALAARGRRPRRRALAGGLLEAEVDDARAVGGGVADALGDAAGHAGAVRVEHPDVISFAFGATPTTPRPLPAAAMIPATCVPWPLPSERSCRAALVVRSTPWTSST